MAGKKSASKPAAKPAPKAPTKAARKPAVAPIPKDQPRVSPCLVTKDAARVIDFLKRVVGAKELYRLAGPDGKVMHAEVRIVDSVVMLSEASDQHPAMPAMLNIYVEDVDATYAKALAAGATAVRPVADQFYGDRSGGVKDPSGNLWWFATHVEDVPHDEIVRRAAAMKKP
jgi:PhnB protein